MIDRRIPTCYNCGAWDDEREGCMMPAPDRQYACPLEYEREAAFAEELKSKEYRIEDTIKAE